MRVKNGQKDLDSTIIRFPEEAKIYVNDSICPYYKELWNDCEKLWNDNKNYSYFTFSGTVRITQVENGSYKNITHVNDLSALFLEKQISMSWVF